MSKGPSKRYTPKSGNANKNEDMMPMQTGVPMNSEPYARKMMMDMQPKTMVGKGNSPGMNPSQNEDFGPNGWPKGVGQGAKDFYKKAKKK
jgi:hypothetical protein